jgi:hypothetical protein
MALQNPVAVYNASSNVEAQLLRSLLAESGIEAFAIDDVSQVGTWVFGLLPESTSRRSGSTETMSSAPGALSRVMTSGQEGLIPKATRFATVVAKP